MNVIAKMKTKKKTKDFILFLNQSITKSFLNKRTEFTERKKNYLFFITCINLQEQNMRKKKKCRKRVDESIYT